MQKSRLAITTNLFFTMLKIGLFTFGGGYGMIAILENELVQKKQWISKDEFLDVIAIAESTPGPIAINSATYIGYKLAKFWGAFFATLAVCIPSFVIIFLISLFFDAFLSIQVVFYAFKGIQVCVTFLILSAGIKMMKDVKKNTLNIIIFCLTFISVILFSIFSINFSSIFYILISGVVGLFVYLITNTKDKKTKPLSKTNDLKTTKTQTNEQNSQSQNCDTTPTNKQEAKQNSTNLKHTKEGN